MKMNIESFADKYIAFFENEFGLTKQSYYSFFDNSAFPEECRELGFEMDCGHSFINAYGEDAWNDVHNLKATVETLNDSKIIGNGLFSQWRFYNHWSSPSYANEDTKEWFLILFYRLKVLCNTQKQD